MRLDAELLRRRISWQLRSRRIGVDEGQQESRSQDENSPAKGDFQNVDVSGLCEIADHGDFLREAYRRILGREIDVYGLVHHRELLRRGFPKEALIGSLADSEEARKSGRRLVGLRRVRAAAGGRWFMAGGRLRSLRARLALKVRSLVEAVLQARRFQVLDAKLDLLQERFDSESDRSVRPVLEALWQVSEKTDQIARELADQKRAALADAEGPIEAELADMRANAESLADQLCRYKSILAELRQAGRELSATVDRPAREHRALLDELRTSHEASLAAIGQRFRPPTVYGGAGTIATEVEGLIIGVPGEEWRMAAYHVFRGPLEPGLVRAFKEVVQPGMVVVDVGANVGVYTLLAATVVGASGKVISFEPAPRVRAMLRDNVQVNGLLESGIVEIRGEAVLDRCGTAELTVYEGDSGHSTLFGEPPAGEKVRVATETLDHTLAFLPRVDVVKIDAEGAEPFILRGMGETLRRFPKIQVFLEFSPPLLRKAGVEPASFLRALEETGMEVLLVDPANGESRRVAESQLLGCYSENLSLHRQNRGGIR